MAITLHEFELNQETDMLGIINNFSSHRDKVKFALFCAKDCFHYNDDEDKPLVDDCITLIESWLINPDSVTKKQLANKAHKICDFSCITGSCMYEIVYPNEDHAYWAFAYADSCNHNNQYRNYAYSLLRSSSIIPTNTKGKITDKSTLMALLDELSELNENLIIHKDNKVVLNYPTNFATNTLPELVNRIYNNYYLLHYVEHLYDHQ